MLVLAHLRVVFRWLGACFPLWYFRDRKRILITWICAGKSDIQIEEVGNYWAQPYFLANPKETISYDLLLITYHILLTQ